MKRFNKQDPSIRRHGPKKRREVISDLMIALLESDFFNEWRTAFEIGTEVSKGLSNYWTQVDALSAGAIIRRYQKEYGLEVKVKDHINYWRARSRRG